MREKKHLSTYHKKKIWIDLDNSPHVPFFAPIIKELSKCGYQVMLTARNCFQVCGLADRFNLSYKRVGFHYGSNKFLKVSGLILRALQLAPVILREKPDIALSHGSRSQILLASITCIPSVSISDYEYTKKLPFVYPTWRIVPELIPDNFIKRKNVNILKYPGIKEDVYIPGFKPNPGIKDELCINKEDFVVTIRPPATEAHYHNHQSEEIYKAVIDFLIHTSHTRIILLPRDEKQSAFARNSWQKWCNNKKIIIPDHVIDGLNVIWHSDLVISGGGTMNREAAALGVPVYSIFRGKTGAIDQYLVDNGRLTLLESVEDIRKKIALVRRNRPPRPGHTDSISLKKILDYILSIIESDGRIVHT